MELQWVCADGETYENRAEFEAVKRELIDKGTFSYALAYGQLGEWFGIVFEKDMSWADPRDQDHWAKMVFDGNKRCMDRHLPPPNAITKCPAPAAR